MDLGVSYGVMASRVENRSIAFPDLLRPCAACAAGVPTPVSVNTVVPQPVHTGWRGRSVVLGDIKTSVRVTRAWSVVARLSSTTGVFGRDLIGGTGGMYAFGASLSW